MFFSKDLRLRRQTLQPNSRISVKATVCAILVVAGLVGPRLASFRLQPAVPESRSWLLKQLGPIRPFEGRLFGLDHQPFDPASRNQLEDHILVDISRNLLREKKESKAIHLGNRALVQAVGGDLEAAIHLLCEATELEDAPGWLWGDLAATYLERYRRTGESRDLLQALESSSRAQEGHRAVPESRFNHALVLEKLSLKEQAHEICVNYLAHDPDSPWVVEASSHLGKLSHRDVGREWERRVANLVGASGENLSAQAFDLVRDFPQASREYVEEDLLGMWGVSWQKGRREEALQHLHIAREIGHALSSSHGDHTTEDAIAAIDRAAAAGSGLDTDVIAELHSRYYLALGISKRESCQKALPIFLQAKLGLEVYGSPFYRWAWFQSAICDFRQFQYREAANALRQLASMPDRNRYPALLGSAYWILGLIEGIEGDPASSLAQYRSSAEAFDRTGERENRAVLDNLMAEALMTLGDLTSAWDHVWRAMQELPLFRDPRNKYRVLARAADLAGGMDSPKAALPLIEESLRVGSITDPIARVSGLRRKAVLCTRLKLFTAARRALEKARQMLPSVTDPDARGAFEGDLLAIEGEVLSAEDPEQAVGQLTRAIDIYRNTSYQQQLTNLLFRRGRAQLASGRPDLAAVDLENAIRLVEKQRIKVPNQDLESFFDQRRAIYDEMTKAQFLLARPVEALLYTEQRRARILRDSLASLSSLGTQDLSLASLQQKVAANTAIIEYAFLEDASYVWLIRRTGVEWTKLAVSTQVIDSAVEVLQHAVKGAGPPAQFQKASALVFDEIFRPIQQKLAGVSRLVFVPDGALHQLPFPALWDRQTERFLVEDFTIVVSPSASTYAVAARRGQAQSTQLPTSILLVGNPTVERTAWPSLPNLPDAAEEVKEIAPLYPKAELLLGRDATRDAVLSKSSASQVIHLATHTIVNWINPPLSAVVLSPSGEQGDVGALYVRDLLSHRYPETRLVILATCSSLGGHVGRTEGVSSLARPFLLQGIPSVIGTIWAVEDHGSKGFFVRLHTRLRKGLDPASALREVQIDFIRHQGEPSTDGLWAAFLVIGA